MATVNNDINETNVSSNWNTSDTNNNQAKNSPKTKAKTFEEMSDRMINLRVNKYNDLYDRAIKQAQINWNYDLVQILNTEAKSLQGNNKAKVEKVWTLLVDLKEKVSIPAKWKLEEYDVLKAEYDELKVQIDDDFVQKWILKKVNGKYVYSEGKTWSDVKIDEVRNPKLGKLLTKALN